MFTHTLGLHQFFHHNPQSGYWPSSKHIAENHSNFGYSREIHNAENHSNFGYLREISTLIAHGHGLDGG